MRQPVSRSHLKVLVAGAGAGTIALVLMLATTAFGASESKRSQITIKEHGSSRESPDGSHHGTFSLALDFAPLDSGSRVIQLTNATTNGGLKIVDGQLQQPVAGYNNLTGRKGTLTLYFSGITIQTDKNYGIEYGTWKIANATGKYKGWKGGGRWANVATPSADHVEWDGFVTH